jgi:hypothetical protein
LRIVGEKVLGFEKLVDCGHIGKGDVFDVYGDADGEFWGY